MPGPDTLGGGGAGVVRAWIAVGSRLGHAIFPGTSTREGSQSFARAGLRLITPWLLAQQRRPPSSQGSTTPTSSSSSSARGGPTTAPSSRSRMGSHYRGRDGKWYPYPPRDWSGTREQWEAVSRARGAVFDSRAAAEGSLRKRIHGVLDKPVPPPPRAPEPTPQLPDAPKGTNFDVFPWVWLGQMIWDQRDAVTRAVFRTKLHIPVKPRPMPTPTALPAPPRIPSENFPPAPQLPPQPLEVPKIYRPRMRVPRTVQPGRTTDTLSVPTITARPLPTPKLSGPPKPMPVATLPKASIFSKFDPLTLAYLLPRGSKVEGGKLRIVGDPLTANIPQPLTSPLGSFAGVPATADCSCSKSPKKRGKRKRRTVCYEGTYRETASGTRKLRRREVPCT